VQVGVATIPPVWRAVVALSRNRTVSNLYKRFVIAEGDVDQRTAEANFSNQVRADPAAAREWLRDGNHNSGLAALLDRQRPTLVVVAQQDHLINASRLASLVGTNPNIRVVTDTGQGHGWNGEAVQRQLGLMQSFFDGGARPQPDATPEPDRVAELRIGQPARGAEAARSAASAL
jgi:pimeloyl-ACP methyl ester carboxylesterase